MTPLKLALITLFSAAVLPACATVNKGTSDFFRIDSVPQGAIATTTIETDESVKARRKNPQLEPEYIGCSPTPCAIKLNRRQKFVIKLEHGDFQTAEMFITNSRNSASFTANMATTTATTAGTMAAGAAVGAGVATALAGVTSGVLAATTAGTATLGTLGLIPLETSLAVAQSAFVAPTYSASSAAAASIPPALIVTGGMLLFDAASGANINLYPNPVVLELAPNGVPSKIDPNVAIFKAELEKREKLERECMGGSKPSTDRILRCRTLVTRKLRRQKKQDDAQARRLEKGNSKRETAEEKLKP